MAKRLELQIEGTSTFAFEVEGEFLPSREPEYRRTASAAPVIVGMRDVWELRNCRIANTDPDTLWVDIKAFLARFETAAAHPTYVRLVRDPLGAAEVLWTLGPADGYEDLRFSLLQGEIDSDHPDATWQVTGTFTIRVSARLNIPDGATTIVGWDQTVSISYPFGFRVLEWRTTVTTAEGVSAVTAAQTYARIPIGALGGDHSYDTNGPDGIDYLYTDADEENSRVATVVEVVSRARQWAQSVGVTSGQGSPSTFQHVITREVKAEENLTRTFAMARGPNALAYVVSKKPLGAIAETVEVDRLAISHYERTWTQRKKANQSAADVADTIRITISGGHRAQIWRPIVGGRPPHHSVGAFKWWEVTIEVASFKVGDEALTFPGPPTGAWVLQENLSQETETQLDGERQSDVSQQKYVRQARLILRSNSTDPFAGAGGPTSILSEMRQAARVESYLNA